MKTIDLSSYHEWMSEQFQREIPPEEGFGAQPIIDHLNQVTAAYNLLHASIVKYCKFIGHDEYPMVHGASPECQHDWRDARNKIVVSGEFCLKCYAIRAGNTTPPSIT